jgi:hypothetical protein
MMTVRGDLTEEEISERCRRWGMNRSDFIRPEWATHRIITTLSVSWGAWPEDPPGVSYAMLVSLDRAGQAIRKSGDRGAGMPRHKLRTIDLRVGDEVMTLDGRWAKIRELYAYRQHWLTAEQAAAIQSDGYLYELTAPAATASNA